MQTRGWGGALLLGALLGGACAEEPVGSGGPDGAVGADSRSEAGTDGSGDGSSPASCAWDVQAPELKLPESELQGVLRGTSRNASTTCTRQKGTGGPEAFYLLRLTERTLVDLEVVSGLDTVLAIRRACDDPLTEVACSDGPGGSDGQMKADAGVFGGPGPFPPFPVDAGVPPPTTMPGTRAVAGRDAHLRASLAAGTYFVLVDEAEPFGVGGSFQLRVRASSPPAQTTCASAPVVSNGTHLLAEELDLASEKSPCGGESRRPALFYRAVIPGGARLTARAMPTAGDVPWTPAMQLYTSCDGANTNLCLASDTATVDGQRMLRYVNNGAVDQAVWLAVSALETVTGALFRLDVTIAQPLENVTCQAAQPLSDGLVLHNQDLSEARSDVSSPCRGAPSLYYSARLYPRQTLQVVAAPPDGQPFFPFPIVFTVGEGCASNACTVAESPNVLFYTNTASEPRTVFVEASTFRGLAFSFDMQVMMPLPPGEISVLTDRGLVTTEGGGQATFRVVLNSPATALVEVPLTSTDPAEGQVSPAVLRFSAEDWDRPQTVTVTGVDDSKRDGTRPYIVKVGPSVSADPRYQGLEGAKVPVANLDDEPGFRVEAPSTLVTSEGGASATFRVFLNRAPTAPVRLPLSSSDDTEGKVSAGELVFEPGNWSEPRTVTVLGLDDDEQDGSQSYQVILGAASSDDPDYQGIDPPDLPARNADDDFQRVAATDISGSLSCSNISPYGTVMQLAVDQASTLYAGMVCQSAYRPAPLPPSTDAGVPDSPPRKDGGDYYGPTALVATSVDGGRTFGAPVDTGLQAYYVVIAAGRPGLVLAAGTGPYGVVISRSEDSGVTWQPQQVVQPNANVGSVRLAAAGDRVVLYTDGMGPVWWVSDDGGRTFEAMKGPEVDPGQKVNNVITIGVDPDGTIWDLDWDPRVGRFFRSSPDGGATWVNGALLFGFDPTAVGVGATMLYVGGKELVTVARDGSSAAKVVTSLPPPMYYNHLLVADQKDNVVVLSGINGQVEARRLASGDSAFSPTRTLGPSDTVPAAVALSERAIAVMLASGGHISVAVEVWP